MNCAACGSENPAGARFCGRCGQPLERRCPSCGAVADLRVLFCTDCGARLDQAPVQRRVGEERKVVSVLFADLVGFTSRAERLDPEDVRAVLAPYSQRLREELERFGGTVEKFIGDAVMAVFGAPAVHEDDPERAVRAGLAIRAAIAGLNEAEPQLDLRVRIAVTTGEALVALGARARDGEGMATGDVVNTASRLQTAAPVNGLLVDVTTYRATAHAIEYRRAGDVRAKGKAEPIAVWEAVGPRPAGHGVARVSATPLIGRAKELDLLLDALARARAERAPQLLTLTGVPGIGKSRLLWELFRNVEAEQEPIAWRQGRSLPYGDGVTFWALGEMVKAEAGILVSDPAEVAIEKLDRAVREVVADPDEAEWVEGHLRPLVGVSGEADGDQRSEAFAAWRRFLEGLADRSPLVLAFEDLHWADDALLDFIDHLIDWASGVPLFVVCTARPELLERRPAWGGGKRNAATVSLSPLTPEQTAGLVSALLEQALLPTGLQAALLGHAEGNPLYAEEYVRMLVDRGFLRRVGAGRRVEPSEELPLPESVQGLIAARLDLLPVDEKHLLQDAAVLGKVFWSGALGALTGLDGRTIDEGLHGLERKEFLRREPRSALAGESQHSFVHALVRDVAYGQIPRARRAEKHRLAAEWIESVSGDRLEDRAEMRAHHYLRALEFGRAARQETGRLADQARRACRDAGDRAASLHAFAAAARFYGAALELWWPDAPGRPQILLRYAKARLQAEGAGAEELAEAREGLLALGDREGAAEAEIALGQLAWWQGRQEESFAHHERAAALVEERAASLARAQALCNLAGMLMVAGKGEDAIRVGWEGFQLAEELENDDLRAAALNTIGYARADYGDLGGVVDLERSIAIAEERNSPAGIRSCGNLADLVGNLGDLERRFELQTRALRYARRFGDRTYSRWFEALRAVELYCRGRWDDALDAASDAVGEWANLPLEITARLVRGRIELARGNADSALEDARQALAVARALRDPHLLYPALAFEALVRTEAGSRVDADASVDELLALWAAGEHRFLASWWIVDVVRALAALGREDELVDAAARAGARTRWLDAAEAFAGGDFGRAAELLGEIGAAPEAAHARLRAAEAALAAGDRASADAELAPALAFYREAGAAALVRAGEALLAAPA